MATFLKLHFIHDENIIVRVNFDLVTQYEATNTVNYEDSSTTLYFVGGRTDRVYVTETPGQIDELLQQLKEL